MFPADKGTRGPAAVHHDRPAGDRPARRCWGGARPHGGRCHRDALPLPHIPLEARPGADPLQFKQALADGHVAVPTRGCPAFSCDTGTARHQDADGYAAMAIKAPLHSPAASHVLESASGGTPSMLMDVTRSEPRDCIPSPPAPLITKSPVTKSPARLGARRGYTRQARAAGRGQGSPGRAKAQGLSAVRSTIPTMLTASQWRRTPRWTRDASFLINGYAGSVVARLHIYQDILMDQDADIDFAIDGDGHFSVLLDQDMSIEQDIDIDLHLFDAEGVLYVDLFPATDRVSIEQDTTPAKANQATALQAGSVEVHQNLEMDQDVDIDVDVEDDPGGALSCCGSISTSSRTSMPIRMPPSGYHVPGWGDRHGCGCLPNGICRSGHERSD